MQRKQNDLNNSSKWDGIDVSIADLVMHLLETGICLPIVLKHTHNSYVYIWFNVFNKYYKFHTHHRHLRNQNYKFKK